MHENFFKESINKLVAPLQARDDKVSENRLIAKHMEILRSTHHKGQIGYRSKHDTRIGRFWRNCDVSIMIHFRNEFQNLHALGFLETDDNKDT